MSNITVYTRQLCGYCSAAINLLERKKAKYDVKDATFDPALRKEMIDRANGAATFPQIFIGEAHVGGCDDLMELERAGKLDGMIERAASA